MRGARQRSAGVFGVAPVDSRAAASTAPRGPETAWRLAGWFGLLFVVVGLAEMALTALPLRLGVPEWEFGTVAALFSSLPMLTIGAAALLASAIARGNRWLIRACSWGLIVVALVLWAALAVFVLDIPIALQLSPAEVILGIQKAIAKTVLLGLLFPSVYLVAAGFSLSHLSRVREGGDHA